MAERMHISNSGLSCYQQCPEKYRRRYLERERVPGTLKMKRGTAVHRVATDGHRRQLQAIAEGVPDDAARLSLPSIEEASDLAATYYDAEIRAGVTLSKEEATQGRAIIDRGRDIAVGFSALYVGEVAPEVTPVDIERKATLALKTNEGLVDLVGITDLVTRKGPIEDVRRQWVRDLKSSGKAPAKNAAHISQQLTTYALLHKATTGHLPEGLALDYVFESAKGPDFRPLETTRDEASVAAFLRRLAVTLKAIRAGVFPATDPANWWCSATYCEFFSTCPYV